MGKELQGKDWLREKVRIRDNHTCQRCGKKWIKGQRRFDTHHLDEHRQSSYDYNAKELHRMITLCHKCHFNLPASIKSFKNRSKSTKHIRVASPVKKKKLRRPQQILNLYLNGFSRGMILKMFYISREEIDKIIRNYKDYIKLN